jgi:hypothetical protein
MKQIWPNYSYSPTTNVLTLTGLNIDRDQLLLVTAADRGRIMYNFADSSVTASAFTSGANTALTLVATTAGLTTTAALVIYFDDQATSSTVTGTVELGPTSLNALESITVTMGQVTVTGGLTDVQLRASAVTVGGTVTVGNSLTISSLPAISGTVTANVSTFGAYGGTLLDYNGANTLLNVGIQKIGNNSLNLASYLPVEVYIASNPISASNPIPSRILIGTGSGAAVSAGNPMPISGTVTIGAGTAQIGSVTASISGIVPVSGTFFQGTQPVSLTTLPALVAGTAQIGSVTASISNSVTIASFATSVTARLINPAGTAVTYAEVGTAGNPSIDVISVQGVTAGTPLNVYPMQGTTVSNTNFTSTTASTSLVSAVTGRESLTVFNEGAGNLHISPGATCTTISYQVRLSAGDYWECPAGQLSLAHSAVFATAGTARVTQVS